MQHRTHSLRHGRPDLPNHAGKTDLAPTTAAPEAIVAAAVRGWTGAAGRDEVHLVQALGPAPAAAGQRAAHDLDLAGDAWTQKQLG